MLKGAPEGTVGIPMLQTPRQDRGQGRPGNHPELALPGNGTRQAPTGNSYTHPALDDARGFACDPADSL